MKYLLIQNDTVLTFKTLAARDSYQAKKLIDKDIWLAVEIEQNFYTVTNPYLSGNNKKEQFYTFNEVLKYSGSFA